MNDSLATGLPAADGIVFTVTVGTTDRKCVITDEALKSLCECDDDYVKPKEIFWAYEDRIYQTARRMVKAGDWRNPVVLEPQSFS